ncbi:hypothetical protein MtrunA17_Chr7g0229711 [Medicago truncatula]|nr:hypothetical protein MtrunA17_Chr7g0229711 [Medicago truncatula]
MRQPKQLVFNKRLHYENLSMLSDFLVKHVLLKDTSLAKKYKGYAYNCLQTHDVLDVLGSSNSKLVELIQDVHIFAFDKDRLDGVEKHTLFPSLQVSLDTLQKLLDLKHILTQHVEDLKHQLPFLESVLESITQQEAQTLAF